MADAAAPGLLPVAADRDRERDKDKDDRRRWAARCGFAVLGIMSTLLVYGVLQVSWVRLLLVLLLSPLATISSSLPLAVM
jgi:adenosine 3'-phospho 5'-phosphosulfate transporter B2